MRSTLVHATALTLAITAYGAAARADMFDVKGVEVTKGETELAFAVAPQSGHNANSDHVRLHGEASVGYGLSAWFKVGGKLGFELPADAGASYASYGGVETQAMLIDPRKGTFGLAWFTGFDFGFTQGFSETLTWGPVASAEVAKGLTITVNPLFQKNWSPDSPGIDFNYAWQLKREINDNFGVGVEGYGLIPNIGNAPPGEFHEHRIGPVLYISGPLAAPSGSHGSNGPKAELQLGILGGLTEATPDLTGRAKLAVTW